MRKRVTCFVVLGLLLAAALSISCSDAFKGNVYNLVQIKIADTTVIEDFENDPEAIEKRDQIRAYGFYFVSNISTGFLWALVTDEELSMLEKEGFSVTEIMKGEETDLFKRMVWGTAMVLPDGYHTYNEVVQALKDINAQYPDITSLQVIGSSQQNKREIYALKLTGNPKNNDAHPKILLSAAIHGNEIMGTEICLRLLEILCAGYGLHDRYTRYIDELELWFVPVINADGYHISTTIQPMWRKNARDNDGDGKLSIADGVDPNRNFDFHFRSSGSGDSASRFYRGSAPFSESESRMMADLIEENKFVLSFTYHSAESRVYYPWQSDSSNYTPEDKLLSSLAKNIAGLIKCINEDYFYDPVRNIREASYTSNYYYGVLGTIDFMVELGKYDHVYPAEQLKKIFEHNLPGAFYLLDRALGPGLKGKVTDNNTDKPLLAEIKILQFDNSEISPRTSHSETGFYFRILEPGIYDIEVSAENMQKRTIKNVIVDESGWTELDIKLKEM